MRTLTSPFAGLAVCFLIAVENTLCDLGCGISLKLYVCWYLVSPFVVRVLLFYSVIGKPPKGCLHNSPLDHASGRHISFVSAPIIYYSFFLLDPTLFFIP